MKSPLTLSFSFLILCLLTYVAHAAPLPDDSTSPILTSDSTNTTENAPKPITVLPLGDSITFGVGTPDSNSYRSFLQALLALDAKDIEFVGSVTSGRMVNNQNEGHSGATIDEISTFADAVLPSKPQIVTLLAGTNDIGKTVDISNAPTRLLNLITKIHTVSPNTTVLVGSLPPLTERQTEVDDYNKAVQDLITNTFGNITLADEASPSNATAESGDAGEGKRVIFVSMGQVTVEDMVDGVHPNVFGYRKMGEAWARAVEIAFDFGWLDSGWVVV